MAEIPAKTKDKGTIVAVTAGTPVKVDLSEFAGTWVKIFSIDSAGDFNFKSSDPGATPALKTAVGDLDGSAGDVEADVADAFDKGPAGVQRLVDRDETWLVVDLDATGDVRIKQLADDDVGY